MQAYRYWHGIVLLELRTCFQPEAAQRLPCDAIHSQAANQIYTPVLTQCNICCSQTTGVAAGLLPWQAETLHCCSTQCHCNTIHWWHQTISILLQQFKTSFKICLQGGRLCRAAIFDPLQALHPLLLQIHQVVLLPVWRFQQCPIDLAMEY